MSGRAVKHYGYRSVQSIIPCVEITEPRTSTETLVVPGRGPSLDRSVRVTSDEVVKRVYGFTIVHAINRALRWMHEHGDPR